MIEKNQTGDIYEESIISKLGENIIQSKNDFEIRKYWNNKNGKLKKKVFDSKRVSDKDFKTIVECFYNMKQSKKYAEYKKYFDKMCSICKIPTNQCIIQYYNLVKGKKPNKNEICITYANTTQKIIIPADCELYHRSTNHNITELLPFFQGKAARGYLLVHLGYI